MLRKFSVTNFMNFRKTVCIDLTDVRGYGFNTHCIRNGLVDKAIIIGRNGSGKTNLSLALSDIARILTDGPINIRLLDPSLYEKGSPAAFVFEFQQGERIIRYEYSRSDPETIVYESLHLNGELAFVRDGEAVDCSNLGRHGLRILDTDFTDARYSVLGSIRSEGPDADSPIAFMEDFVYRMVFVRTDAPEYETTEQYILSYGLVEDFQGFLKDTAGLDMRLEAVRPDGTYGTLAQRIGDRLLYFGKTASSGTKALMTYYRLKHLYGGMSFLYMDCPETFLHHEAAEKIVRDVVSQGTFQALISTRDTGLVNNRILRPDCCFLLTESGLRSFPNRTSRELREGHNLEKLLRGGEFDDDA